MTSYYEISATVNRLRRRPEKTSTNGATIRQIFGDNSRKLLPIPAFIDDYNQHMGGVDIADQLRSYYSTQLRACQNWLPLFFWLLDTAIVNSYRIMKSLYPHRKVRSQHLFFWEDLADKLIEIGLYEGGYMDSSSSEPLATPPSPPRPTTSSTPSTHSERLTPYTS